MGRVRPRFNSGLMNRNLPWRDEVKKVAGSLTPKPGHPVLIFVVEMNDLSSRQLFHAHVMQIADVFGSDPVVAKFGDV